MKTQVSKDATLTIGTSLFWDLIRTTTTQLEAIDNESDAPTELYEETVGILQSCLDSVNESVEEFQCYSGDDKDEIVSLVNVQKALERTFEDIALEYKKFDYDKLISKKLNASLDSCNYFLNELEGTECLKDQREELRVKGQEIFQKKEETNENL
tara:strand:+ start:336 stop:800 length:465 start_codon:yes stop_codon:yes gene_type:complete